LDYHASIGGKISVPPLRTLLLHGSRMEVVQPSNRGRVAVLTAKIRLRFDDRSTAYQRSLRSQCHNPLAAVTLTYLLCPLGRGIKRWCCLTSVCLSRISGLSREQRGLGRLKLAQRQPTSHVTRTPLLRSEGQRSTCLN